METLKERMQNYEKRLDYKLDNTKCSVIRLDGKGFSKMKRKWKLTKPFDEVFHNAMIYSATYLLENIQDAKLVWTGSDEISIFIDNSNIISPWFSKRLSKWISISASYASVNFNKYVFQYLIQNKFENSNYFNVIEYPAFFDAKVFQFPSIEEALNNLIYRQIDLKRNSITEYANFYFSHKEILNKNSDEKIKLMMEKGFNYNDEGIPWVKFGSLLYKETVIYDKVIKENN